MQIFPKPFLLQIFESSTSHVIKSDLLHNEVSHGGDLNDSVKTIKKLKYIYIHTYIYILKS